MGNFTSKKFQQGIGILEVLIAVVVLSIALLSLGGLHALIIKSSSQAKSRGVATNLAQEKLEGLRAYGITGDSTFPFDNICDKDTMVANPTNYDGTNFDNTILINNVNTIGHSNVTFSRSWNVYGFNFASNAAATYDGGVDCPPDTATDLPDLKLVAMTVTWQDEKGEQHHMLLQSSIANMNARAALSTLNPPCTDCAPKFTLNPAYHSADEDIMHDLGDELKRVSQPIPDTNRGTNDTTSNTLTSFREEVFNQNNQLIGQTSFVTVNCFCNQAAASTFDPGLEPSILDSDIRHYVVGEANTNKRRGTLDTTPSDGLQDQPPICNICCRDHHDDTDASEKYDPFKPSNDYGSSSIRDDHNHYNWEVKPPSDTNNAANDRYAEACRMAWISGQLRVLQDWRLENLIILPPNYFSGVNGPSHITFYSNFVSAFVTKFVKEISTGYPLTMPRRDVILASTDAVIDSTPPAPPALPTIDTSVSDALTALTDSFPSPYIMSTTPEQLSVRGIYIDYMSIDLINTLKCKIDHTTDDADLLTGGLHTSCAGYGITASGNYLHLIPFHDVNLTKLAKWSSSNASNISVTSDSLLDSNETTFSRGKITGITNNSRACVAAKINNSNTGLTVTDAIDPEDYFSSKTIATISSATWASGTATINTSTAHSLATGESVLIDSNVNGFDGTYTITKVDADTFTYTLASNPGASGASGTVNIIVNPVEYKMPVTYGSSGASDPCTPSPSTRITGTVNTPAGTGLTSGDVYITAENVTTGAKCYLTGQGGDYDTNDGCTTQLDGATSIKLYIWHYTHRAGSTNYFNCVYNNGSSPYSGITYAYDDIRCNGSNGAGVNGNSCSSTDLVQSDTDTEYTTVTFSGLTAGSTTTFNFTINTDASDICTTSDP